MTREEFFGGEDAALPDAMFKYRPPPRGKFILFLLSPV